MLYLPDIHHVSTSPIYTVLYEAIKRDIIGGRLSPNDRMPSIRILANNLSISTTPVETAYQQLLDEGFIESSPRRGYYVTHLPHT